MVLPNVQLVVSYGLRTVCECRAGDYAGRNGQRRAYTRSRRSLERELERHRKKLNGPKNTAKHIEAKQNWINTEAKRIEAEVEMLADMQDGSGPNRLGDFWEQEKIQELVENETTKDDIKMSDGGMDGLDGSLSTRRCMRGNWKQYQCGEVLLDRNVPGLSEGATIP